jgi:hypothetical protein
MDKQTREPNATHTAMISALCGGAFIVIDHLLWGPLPLGEATIAIVGVASLWFFVLFLVGALLLHLLYPLLLRIIDTYPNALWRLGWLGFTAALVIFGFGVLFDPSSMILTQNIYALLLGFITLALLTSWLILRHTKPSRSRVMWLLLGYGGFVLWASGVLPPYNAEHQLHNTLLACSALLSGGLGIAFSVNAPTHKKRALLWLIPVGVSASVFLYRYQNDLMYRDFAVHGGRISRTFLRHTTKYIIHHGALSTLASRAAPAPLTEAKATREKNQELVSALTALRPKNVLLLTIDTLRADLGNAPTPNLDRLSQESVRFHHFYSTSTSTRASLQGIFLGWIEWMLLPQPESIANILQKRGWRTIGVLSTAHMLHDDWLKTGFHSLKYPGEQVDYTAQEINSIFMKELSGEETPHLFAWLHYMEPHAPYQGEGSRKERYAAEISRIDASIGEVIAELERTGALQDTLLIITADHGEEFSEHGGTFHGRSVFNEIIQVPLLIRAPGGTLRGDITSPTSGILLNDALLHWTGVKTENVFRELGATPVFSFHAPYVTPQAQGGVASVVLGDYKLIYELRFRCAMLYNLSQDRLEQKNIIEQEPEIAALLASYLQQELLRSGLNVD